MTERILVLVAHPDDETFGMGGTIARHVRSGEPVSIVAFADGVGSRGNNKEAIEERHGMFRRACKILGTEDVWPHQYADNQMDNLPLLQIVKHIEIHLARFKPTIVYTHWIGDLNVDHQVMHRAVNVACRPLPGSPIKRLMYFEVPCSTAWGEGFSPNYFVDINGTFSVKMEACAQYTTELGEENHPRSLESIERLAMLRGARAGLPSGAEAFVIGRMIE